MCSAHPVTLVVLFQVTELISLEFAVFGLTLNIAELVPSGFLRSTVMVFATVRTHFPKKNTSVYVGESLSFVT